MMKHQVWTSLLPGIRARRAALLLGLCVSLGACSGNLEEAPDGPCDSAECLLKEGCSTENCSGRCVDDECVSACSRGSSLCGDSCFDLSRSELHCGDCGNGCDETESCKSGKCEASTACTGPGCECASGRDACDGVCVDTSTNLFHCGSCGSECDETAECLDGSCTCLDGKSFCGEVCVELLDDNKHCGSCGNVCRGGTSCDSGSCVCPSGQSLCDGFCVDTLLSRNHCGACGVSCQGNERCTLGSCDASEDDCGGAATSVDISKVSLYQAVEIPLFEEGMLLATADREVDVVEARSAFVRVHVETQPGFQPRELSARVVVENLGESKLFHHKRSISESSSQSELTSTFNISLPASSIGADTNYRIELVECGTPADGPVGKIRLPALDSAPLGARKTGVVRVVLVPVLHDGRLPDTSSETMTVFAREVERVFPVSGVELSVGDEFDSQQSGADVDLDVLLDDITNLRIERKAPSDVYYYGLIDPAETSDKYCEEDCTTGLAWITGGNGSWATMHRAAVGVGFGTWGAETFSHELGHNHGRDHAPCGVEGDLKYPYEHAALGSWGYDAFSGSLRAPDGYVDLMSYCSPPWISDYSYQGILEQVTKVNASGSSEAFRIAPEAQIWARVLITDTGFRWSQSLSAEGPPSSLPEPGFVYDWAGAVLAQIAVHRRNIADSNSYMLFVPPKESGWHAVGIPGAAPIPY